MCETCQDKKTIVCRTHEHVHWPRKTCSFRELFSLLQNVGNKQRLHLQTTELNMFTLCYRSIKPNTFDNSKKQPRKFDCIEHLSQYVLLKRPVPFYIGTCHRCGEVGHKAFECVNGMYFFLVPLSCPNCLFNKCHFFSILEYNRNANRK